MRKTIWVTRLAAILSILTLFALLLASTLQWDGQLAVVGLVFGGFGVANWITSWWLWDNLKRSEIQTITTKETGMVPYDDW